MNGFLIAVNMKPPVRRSIGPILACLLGGTAVIFSAVSPAAGGTLIKDSPRSPHSGRKVSGGDNVVSGSEIGWRTRTTQDAEVRGLPAEGIDFDAVPFDPVKGTLDLLVERTAAEGAEEAYEAIASIGNPALGGEPYPFEAVFYVIWNSALFKETPVLLIDGRGDYGQTTAKVWGLYVPFPAPVKPGGRVHIRITWGADGPATNRIYFNGVEAKRYLAGDGPELSPRTGSVASFVPRTVNFKVGNSLQSPLSGTIYYRMALLDQTLGGAVPFGGEGAAIASVSDDSFKVAGISGKLVSGDTVNVEVVASAGGRASFDLGRVKGIPLPEVPVTEGGPGIPAVPAGTYRGSYTIKPGDDFEEGRVVGRFASPDNVASEPVSSASVWTIDTRPKITFSIDRKELPADQSSRARIKLLAKDANGNPVSGRHVKVTLATTEEYTGLVGAGDFFEQVGGVVEARWRGETDAFGESEFDYTSGFAAKTVILSAKDLDSGGVSVEYLTSYKEASVDIALTAPVSRAAARRGMQYVVKVEATRTELTADGRSRSVVRATVLDPNGSPVSGDPVLFALSSENGSVRTIKGVTDASGVATAEYVAGKKIGIVVVTATATLRGASGSVSITLLSDAPAKVRLYARPATLPADGFSRAEIEVKVTDINDNPNADTKVEFKVGRGGGKVESAEGKTDRYGDAGTRYVSGTTPGIATVVATVRSRVPTAAELSKAGNVLFAGYHAEGDEIRVERWLKKRGDTVADGETVAEYTVGKVADVYPLRAPSDGTLGEILVENWDSAEVGQTLAHFIPAAK